ncbi:MAG: nickel-dependent hydrogenase large subunit [Myxococcales bacterium]|nr:nickel-dependent hydrogenase large subunit [Myxococcales bacterium]
MSDKTRRIDVNYLARVEGEGAFHLVLRGSEVVDAKLRIYEPPRFFEAFLRGRDFREAPDITARICGICPVAYQMSAVHAMEDAAGVKIGGPLRELRRLLYCGEWIESHTLHVAMLHAPDFLGYESAIHMAKDHPDVVSRALALKKVGNEIVALVGGREIHPINVKVGGFYRVPSRNELRALIPRLEKAFAEAITLGQWVSTFDFPDFSFDYEFVSLRHPTEYPFNEGRIVSNRGLDIAVADYEKHFQEQHVAHSNALHSVRVGAGPYHVGPLARFALNSDKLPTHLKDFAKNAGVWPVCTNPFKSIVVRAIEVIYACDEALRIVRSYEEPDGPAVSVDPVDAEGFACTEAPRGSLYHRYRLDKGGLITDARIVPPTSQNQKTIEDDLRRLVPTMPTDNDELLQWRCEQAVRNYDPCISCATHFLRMNVVRQ